MVEYTAQYQEEKRVEVLISVVIDEFSGFVEMGILKDMW